MQCPADPVGSIRCLQRLVEHPEVIQGAEQVLLGQPGCLLCQAIRTADVDQMAGVILIDQVKALDAALGRPQIHGGQQLHQRAITSIERQEHESAFAVAQTGIGPDFGKLFNTVHGHLQKR